jgi:hypothetical protein
MLCNQCQKETNNPKFCSKSCAATFNNTRAPKRKPENTCATCKLPCTTSRTYCRECWLLVAKKRSVEKWNEETIKSMRALGNANFNGRYSYIRGLSRRKYLKSNKDKFCYICQYSYHFDVCHIKDIKSFDENTTIGEVNSLDNLVALCKNHHWEFDTGLISL